MNFLNESVGLYHMLIICVLSVLAIWSFCRMVKQAKARFRVLRGEDKNLPKNFSVMTTDGAHLNLERMWVDGEWRYVLDELPWRFGQPDKERERLAKITPPAVRMSSGEEKWADNFDRLTRSSDYDAVVKARYER